MKTSEKAPRAEAAFIWRNGELVSTADATVPINAVGHASISAVFEGIRAYVDAGGTLQLFRVEDHMRRLHESLRVVRLHCAFSVAELVSATIDLLRANGAAADTYIRPWVFVSGPVRAVSDKTPPGTETVIDIWSNPSVLLTERGVSAGVSSWTRINDRSMPPRVKAFSNYHNSRLAVLEAGANGYDQPIFLNEHGKVAEGTGACIALIRGGRLVTPELTSGVLDSITRNTLLRLSREVLGIEVEEREVDRTELYLADEMFLMGTGWEILPLVRIDGLTVGEGTIGPVTSQLDRSYHDLVRGLDSRYAEWRTAVSREASLAR